ncbi:aminotransferase class I/II-fold pyridoxal phosphate-dependent enzyme [Xanthomarina spongicola]|uniref:8-amino-7-oxononanoate synthase n=1 Tax=Xanthomarina spongicola TaxID=570520 RepID=A0A316EC59_9FLAO|nr:8-amino-7-oxononanoate synthase [Xanthomarina spongicola]PWK20490.1 8-amino-7-oxononanoate synthase [Xanthomarina spongicola]
MNNFPKKLQEKINQRKAQNMLRQLGTEHDLIDFSSNDYLGFSNSKEIFDMTHHYLESHNLHRNGSTGSRLLSGNYEFYNEVEAMLCEFHNCESSLIFNSGYNANLGFFSSVPQRGDIILYDEYIHASIRDGITMSHAKSYKFKHNNLDHLDEMLKRVQHDESVIYIVTESVFSMDGDSPNLVSLINISKKYKAFVVIDEAHATGVFGEKGVGLIQELGLENQVFARLITFGKALGSHGAAILGSKELTEYLVNFARSFIYTTALPPHTLMTIKSVYMELPKTHEISKLHNNITFFKAEIIKNKIQHHFINSNSAIQCCLVSGNENVKALSNQLLKKGFDVKPILSPTVPAGEERLRFCLHSFNSEKEIKDILQLLASLLKI